MNNTFDYNEYFDNRSVGDSFYSNFRIPTFMQLILPANKNAKILDIGCGLGQYLYELKRQGYSNIKGIDISESAIQACLLKGLNVEKINDIAEFSAAAKDKYDYIYMKHVLEHIPKEESINTLKSIRNLLTDGGMFMVAVPNAQSNTNAYWMYEDFTHYTLYTAGSLLYVLKSAGFSGVSILDPKNIEGDSIFKKIIKMFFLKIYELKIDFWNKITSSSYHNPSPRVYSFEVKALAKK